MVLKTMLSRYGFHVDTVLNGKEAVSAVMRTPYDLVLMDIQMPEMNGEQATKEIRALGGDYLTLPIIAVTANAMVGDREKYLSQQMDGYVSKPIKAKDLVLEILDAIEKQPTRRKSSDLVEAISENMQKGDEAAPQNELVEKHAQGQNG